MDTIEYSKRRSIQSKHTAAKPGYHGALYQEHYDAYVKSKGYTTEEKLADVANTELKKMRAKAPKTSVWTYLRYLF